ncbi:MAG: caspase domain-containing protein [Candidatus Scalinduaceae bacterium]
MDLGKKYLLLPILLSYLFFSPTLFAERGLDIVPIRDSTDQQVGLYKESHALIIGSSNYTKGWPKLKGVQEDVRLVRSILEKHGFHVVIVYDPDHDQLYNAFTDFINEYGFKPENRLLFYFAGHGYTAKQSYGEEMGYIIPVDAPNPHREYGGFLTKTINMQQIEVYAMRIQSKHALFLFDSCFSGSIFALSRAVPENITYKTNKPVRQFITSGSAGEQVPDESIFRQQFVTALNGEGDVNEDGYVTGTELGEFLQAKVANYTKGAQHPQYGKIRNPNLDKGDFVFQLNKPDYQTPLHKFLPQPPEIVEDDYFDNLIKEREQNRKEWYGWQENMSSRYSKNQDIDKNDILKSSEKVQMWEEFIAAYSADNPHSKEDEAMRSHAKERLKYWKSRKESTTKLPTTIHHQPRTEQSNPSLVKLRSYSSRILGTEIILLPYFTIPKTNNYKKTDKYRTEGDYNTFYGYSTIKHIYESKAINGNKTVIDHATGIMWHQSGSVTDMK